MNKNESRRRQHCLGIAICMAAFPAAGAEYVRVPKGNVGHLRCRRCYLTIKRCFFRYFAYRTAGGKI